MHERFSEGWRAAGYVGAGILSDYPNSLFEVVLQSRGHIARRVCAADELGKVIGEYCKDFPCASVHYDPEEAKGVIAEVHCHCAQEKKPGCCRHPSYHRAIISVTFQAVKTRKDGMAPALAE